MFPSIGIKLWYKRCDRSAAHLFLRASNSFFSTVNGSDYPAEPIPDRPFRRNSKFPNSNRPHKNVNSNSFNPVTHGKSPNSNLRYDNGNPNSFKPETDGKFLERFKLGFDRELENPEPELVKTEEDAAPEEADVIFNKIKETGLIPNAVAMLDGLCKDGLVQDAMKLFGLMREKGSIPEVVIYTAVVEGFCQAHKFDDAKRIFRKMKNNGVVPNAFTYGVLVRSFCNGVVLDDAVLFVMEMLEAGYSPNLQTFVALVGVCCKERSLEDAQEVIGNMKKKGFFVEEKSVREYLDKKGPFMPEVWEAILGKNACKKSFF